jgi:hypothetical protein
MGIRYLNRFLKENAQEAIVLTKLADMAGKKIAVDISIYMYRFASDNMLIENIYLMLALFRQHRITPIFVFDGKPPDEKRELLQKRREEKREAEEEYNQLKRRLASVEDDAEKQELLYSMDMLKKKFVYIGKKDIEAVKRLIRGCGATYYDAPGEADELCALLAIQGKVWACMSDDMDMFVYGCPRVLRYMSLLHHTTVVYDLPCILERLGITQQELREICVLSGTDYNLSRNDENAMVLSKTLKLFKKYHKSKGTDASTNRFYHWLQTHDPDSIEDMEELKRITDMFDLSLPSHDHLRRFEKIHIEYGPFRAEDIQPILEEDGFLFAC